jgi:hypothetical protein
MQESIEVAFFKKYRLPISVVIILGSTLWIMVPMFGEAAGGIISGLLCILMSIANRKKTKVPTRGLMWLGILLLALGLMLQFHLYPA